MTRRVLARSKDPVPPFFDAMVGPPITDIECFAQMLGVPKYVLTRYIFLADRHYKQFRIRKRSGHGYRTICAPSKQLKGIQRWIMAFILRKVEVSSASTAFRPGNSIVHNAAAHVGKEFVFTADIKDFFPAITTQRVVGLFKSLGYPPRVAWSLGKLTTYQGNLPQGAPSSPDIANIICRKLDGRMLALARKREWSYTRYCDDITVSGEGHLGTRLVARIIEEEGFELNKQKTRLIRRNGRQTVTGLVVNAQVSVPRYRRKIIRAIFHQASLEPTGFAHRNAELAGHLAYLKMVRPADPMLPKYQSVLAAL